MSNILKNHADAVKEVHRLFEETERLRKLIEAACQVFDHYDLPEHAFHYRRKVLKQDQTT